MKALKYNFNIDKLRLCYKQPQQLFDLLKGYNTGDYIQFDCFSLVITDCGKIQESNKEPTKIKTSVLLEDGTLLGEFVFNDSAKYEGKCFFAFENHSLYKVNGYDSQGNKHNYMAFMGWIEQQLGLEKNNLTECEIACDINFNPQPQLQRLIRDTTNYDMIVNGKKVDDNERIAGYGEFYERTRTKRKRYPTIYLSQKKADSPSLKVYDKLAEINEESGKNYIIDWNEFGNSPIWRLEVTVKNQDFREYQQRISTNLEEWGQIETITELLGLEPFRTLLWVYIADRLIYFRNKHSNEFVSLFDIATKSI